MRPCPVFGDYQDAMLTERAVSVALDIVAAIQLSGLPRPRSTCAVKSKKNIVRARSLC